MNICLLIFGQLIQYLKKKNNKLLNLTIIVTITVTNSNWPFAQKCEDRLKWKKINLFEELFIAHEGSRQKCWKNEISENRATAWLVYLLPIIPSIARLVDLPREQTCSSQSKGNQVLDTMSDIEEKLRKVFLLFEVWL